MNVMAVALVFFIALAVAASLSVVTWGLVLEARSNRCWRERGLA